MLHWYRMYATFRPPPARPWSVVFWGSNVVAVGTVAVFLTTRKFHRRFQKWGIMKVKREFLESCQMCWFENAGLNTPWLVMSWRASFDFSLSGMTELQEKCLFSLLKKQLSYAFCDVQWISLELASLNSKADWCILNVLTDLPYSWYVFLGCSSFF